MAVENEGFWGMYVELTENVGSNLLKGRKGLCTADLQSNNAFAVWFDDPVSLAEDGRPIHWATFDWVSRDKFVIVGDRRDELREALSPLTTRIENSKK